MELVQASSQQSCLMETTWQAQVKDGIEGDPGSWVRGLAGIQGRSWTAYRASRPNRPSSAPPAQGGFRELLSHGDAEGQQGQTLGPVQ